MSYNFSLCIEILTSIESQYNSEDRYVGIVKSIHPNWGGWKTDICVNKVECVNAFYRGHYWYDLWDILSPQLCWKLFYTLVSEKNGLELIMEAAKFDTDSEYTLEVQTFIVKRDVRFITDINKILIRHHKSILFQNPDLKTTENLLISRLSITPDNYNNVQGIT